VTKIGKIEKMQIPSVSAVLHRNGYYVVVYSDKREGRPVLPGGKVEKTDSCLPAACTREVKEETGIDIEFNNEPHLTRVHVGTDGKHYRNNVFRNEIGDREVVSGIHDEGRVGWMSLSELRAQSPFGPLYTDKYMGICKMPRIDYREFDRYIIQYFPFVMSRYIEDQFRNMVGGYKSLPLEEEFERFVKGRSEFEVQFANDGICVTHNDKEAAKVVKSATKRMRALYGMPGNMR